MKKKRLEIIRTDKFWKDRVDERIQLLYLDGKDLKTKGYYDEENDVYSFEKAIVMENFPELFDIRISDMPSDLIIYLKLKKREGKIFRGFTFANKDGKLMVAYLLVYLTDETNIKKASNWAFEMQYCINSGLYGKDKFEICQEEVEGAIFFSLRKYYNDPKITFRQLLNPDIEQIKKSLRMADSKVPPSEKLLDAIFSVKDK